MTTPSSTADADQDLADLRASAVRQVRSGHAWNQFALRLLRAQMPKEALHAAAQAVSVAPCNPEYRCLLAMAMQVCGDFAQAIGHYELALQLAPDDVRILGGLGSALSAIGQTEEAARCFERALNIDPADFAARTGLTALRRAGPTAPSAEAVARAQALEAEGERLEANGSLEQALAAYAQCARLIPSSAVFWYKIGSIVQRGGHNANALMCTELASRLDPSLFSARHNAGRIAASCGLAERASWHLGAAHRLRPQDGIVVRLKLVTDAIHQSVASITNARQRFAQGIDELLDERPRIVDPLNKADVSTFYLAYHGICNRELHTKLGQLYLRSIPKLDWQASHCQLPRRRSARLKVGFVSAFLRHHSIGKTTRGFIAELPRERFEVFTINLLPGRDSMGDWITTRADRALTLTHDLAKARSEVAALGLDILFYQDIGMESLSYFLAFSRLAPVQCVSFGHPDTTGIPNIDYFISNDLYETPAAAEHYSERLVQLHDLPTLSYYYRPELVRPASRSEFGLPDSRHLYLCPQTLFKLHPDFDRMLAGILRRDNAGTVLLIDGHCAEWTMSLRRRFERELPDVVDRIEFLPRLETERFVQLLGAVDVVLDTVHFNGMNTSLEAFAVGTPVVTLPTELQRGRHTQAMYRKMKIDGCVAGDAQEYVEIAVGLGRDRDRRLAVRELILERNHALYEDSRVISEFGRFFETAYQAACENR